MLRRCYVSLTQVSEELSDVADREELPAGPGGLGSVKLYPVDLKMQDLSEEHILDWFHETVPIGCLEDFEWAVIDTDFIEKAVTLLLQEQFVEEHAAEIGTGSPAATGTIEVEALQETLERYGVSWAEVTGTDPARTDRPSEAEIQIVREFISRIDTDHSVFRIPLDRDLTPEEAEAAYNASPEIPLSKERIDEIVEYVRKHSSESGEPDAEQQRIDNQTVRPPRRGGVDPVRRADQGGDAQDPDDRAGGA